MLFLDKWAKLSIFIDFLPLLSSKLRVIRFCTSDYEGVRPTDNLEPAGSGHNTQDSNSSCKELLNCQTSSSCQDPWTSIKNPFRNQLLQEPQNKGQNLPAFLAPEIQKHLRIIQSLVILSALFQRKRPLHKARALWFLLAYIPLYRANKT